MAKPDDVSKQDQDRRGAGVLFVAGALLLTAGAGMIYLPAGLLVSGALCVALGMAASR